MYSIGHIPSIDQSPQPRNITNGQEGWFSAPLWGGGFREKHGGGITFPRYEINDMACIEYGVDSGKCIYTVKVGKSR